MKATKNIAVTFSLVPPSPQPNYICGVTADGISSLPLWDGGDNFPSHLPRSSSARCPPPNMRTVHRNALLDTVAPKDMIHAKTGGRNNLYDWIPSSPDVFPSSYMGGPLLRMSLPQNKTLGEKSELPLVSLVTAFYARIKLQRNCETTQWSRPYFITTLEIKR